MVNENEKTFKEELQELKEFLAERRLLSDLAKKANCTTRTVHYTFNVADPSELTGKKVLVIQIAQELKEGIISNKLLNHAD
jgi:predicted GTPase